MEVRSDTKQFRYPLRRLIFSRISPFQTFCIKYHKKYHLASNYPSAAGSLLPANPSELFSKLFPFFLQTKKRVEPAPHQLPTYLQ